MIAHNNIEIEFAMLIFLIIIITTRFSVIIMDPENRIIPINDSFEIKKLIYPSIINMMISRREKKIKNLNFLVSFKFNCFF